MTATREQLTRWDAEHVWHPFTQMAQWCGDEPLLIDRAEGCYLFDVDGNRYLDGVSSLWVNVHGHRRSEIDRAVQRQLEKVAHSTLLGLGHGPAAELARRLVERAPEGLVRVFYSDAGSTAVEVALKMAYQYWQHAGRPEKTRFVALSDAYHGDTLGAVSVGGIDLFHALFRPLLFQALRVTRPTEDGARAVDELRDLFARRSTEIAAVIVEPLVQGAAGIQLHPPGYLAEVSRLCREADVLLIADEVATGFGRTGAMFACEHEGVSPDLLCLAKGITAGYLPLAATLATDEIYRAFLGRPESARQFFHGHTYTGNPLACAAAIASLELFDRDRVLDHVRARADDLARELAKLSDDPWVGAVRQRGLMAGIDLVADGGRAQSFAADLRMGARVCKKARGHGVLLRPLGDTVVVMPPLCIDGEQVVALTAGLSRAIAEVRAEDA